MESCTAAGAMVGRPRQHAHAIPTTERRGPVTMGLLWLTMIAGFPTVLFGFDCYKNAFTLNQVIACTILGSLIVLAYSIPATQIGARTGLNYSMLSRIVFGRGGAAFISINLITMSMSFYALYAVLLADSLKGMYHWTIPRSALAVLIAFAMAFNNFFAFSGIANFARFFTGPVLICWITYTFFKCIPATPLSIFAEPSHQTMTAAITSISGFAVGFAVWGNEKDFWRYSKPKLVYSLWPLVASLTLGIILFPVTGWLVASIGHVTNYGAATEFLTDFSFARLVWLSALVLAAAYFATNDSALFGSIQACESFKHMAHRSWAVMLAAVGGAIAYFLATVGASEALEAMASLNGVFLPTPTVIIMAEWFLKEKIFRAPLVPLDDFLKGKQCPVVSTIACLTLVSALIFGVLTSGVIPGTERLHVGICSLQTWIFSLVIYVPARLMFHHKSDLARGQ